MECGSGRAQAPLVFHVEQTELAADQLGSQHIELCIAVELNRQAPAILDPGQNDLGTQRTPELTFKGQCLRVDPNPLTRLAAAARSLPGPNPVFRLADTPMSINDLLDRRFLLGEGRKS